MTRCKRILKNRHRVNYLKIEIGLILCIKKYYHDRMSSNKKTIVKIFHDGFKQKIDIKKKKETKK